MASTHKSNPTHGAKNTTTPASPKQEGAGPIVADSLAAESLRSEHGSFAKGQGNPGISGSSAHNCTFAALGGKELHRDREEEVYRGPEGVESKVKDRSGAAGTSGGGKQAREAFNQGSSGLQDIEGATGSKHSGGSGSAQRSSGEEVGGQSDPRIPILNSAGSRMQSVEAPHLTGTVGKGEDVDWTEIPKDTKPATNIGSEEDPGREALRELSGRAARSTGVGTRDVQGGNAYEALDVD